MVKLTCHLLTVTSLLFSFFSLTPNIFNPHGMSHFSLSPSQPYARLLHSRQDGKMSFCPIQRESKFQAHTLPIFGNAEMAVFILEDAISVWRTYFSVVRRSRRTTEDSSSRRIMRLVPVFILGERRITGMFAQVRPDG